MHLDVCTNYLWIIDWDDVHTGNLKKLVGLHSGWGEEKKFKKSNFQKAIYLAGVNMVVKKPLFNLVIK